MLGLAATGGGKLVCLCACERRNAGGKMGGNDEKLPEQNSVILQPAGLFSPIF